MAKMTIIPKCHIILYNPLKTAIFAISKDGRIREPKQLKLNVRLLTNLFNWGMSNMCVLTRACMRLKTLLGIPLFI